MSVEQNQGSDPMVVGRNFLMAVYEGDPGALWEAFSGNARKFIVARGIRRGMPEELGGALLSDTADVLDHVEFLADLLGGIEKDLANVDLSRIVMDEDMERIDDGRVRVRYLERFTVEVGPPLDPLPVGSLELVEEQGVWRVDRLVPRPG